MNAIDVFADARPDVDVDPSVLDAIAADVFDGRRRYDGVRWRLLGVAAAVVVFIAGLVAVVGRPDGAAPVDSVPPVAGAVAEPLALLPDDVTRWQMTGLVSTPLDLQVRVWSAVIARSDGGGGYDSPVWVRRGPADATLVRVGGFESESTLEAVGLDDDRLGELVTDPAAGHLIVQFELGDGTAVTVTTGYREPLSGERARVMQIAAGIVTLDDDGVRFDSVPDGFEIVAPWELDSVPLIRSVFATRVDRVEYAVRVAADPDQAFAVRAMHESVEPVEVRGTTGFLSTRRYVGRDDVQALSVVWQEQPGQWVSVEDQEPMSRSDLLAFVESLRVVPVDAWESVVEPLPGSEQDPPATSAPVGTDPLNAPGTTASSPAPDGTVLVANASTVAGLGGQWTATLEAQGAVVLPAANAALVGGGLAAESRLYVRPGSEVLGEWVSAQFGLAQEPIDDVVAYDIEGGVAAADVVIVLGTDRADRVALDRMLVIGDQITLGAEAELLRRGYEVDAGVSRQLSDFLPLVDRAVAERRGILVLQIGTNGTMDPATVEAMLDGAADIPKVIVINTDVDRPWASANNALLAAIDEPGDNLIVLDWDALADECPGECFASDGVHLTQAGAEYFVDELGEITGY